MTTTTALRVVLTRLGELPEGYATPAQRQRWTRILHTVPTTPLRTIHGHRTLAPARSWSRIQNEELPQLYPVWPWRVYGVGRPDLQLAIDTFRYGADHPDQHGTAGWKQDPIFAACLGLTTEAATMVEAKLSDSPRRYPAFWGPNFDWTPDLNHLGSAAIALQEMLLAADGRHLHLLPAWPPTWDVDFKVHAPYETVVEGSVIGGHLTNLRVKPHSRLGDVIVHYPYR